jgi:signal transduction histidine kinase
MALANERLHAQVRAQLGEVEASRTRIVQATDAERRRIERNLHDGAQQRLVALRLSLAMASNVAKTDPHLAASLRASAAELDAAIAELRELARGIHPAVLTDEGLVAAVQVLVERAGLPVDLQIDVPTRPPEDLEAAAYYVVAEALANVAKHAAATSARVLVVKQSDRLVVSVSDDGAGGADLHKGTGLMGLADRVAALAGTFHVSNADASGTTVRAEFPWSTP